MVYAKTSFIAKGTYSPERCMQALFIHMFLPFLGHHLTNRVFSQHKTASVTECAQYCVRESSVCKSINYKSRHNQDSSKNCQLNNATKLIQPQNLMVNIDYDYYEPLIKVIKRFCWHAGRSGRGGGYFS